MRLKCTPGRHFPTLPTLATLRCEWRVNGPKGAAVRLGLKPTTLELRMKRLGIVRPG
jgi:hypothetical protein